MDSESYDNKALDRLNAEFSHMVRMVDKGEGERIKVFRAGVLDHFLFIFTGPNFTPSLHGWCLMILMHSAGSLNE